jgi:hypothetical protein
MSPGPEADVAHPDELVFRHACAMGFEGIVSNGLCSRYRSGRSADWLKFKNPAAPELQRAPRCATETPTLVESYALPLWDCQCLASRFQAAACLRRGGFYRGGSTRPARICR